MKWINGETWKSYIARRETWHKWFAWHPVTVSEITMPDGKIRSVKAWLCTVQRKGEYGCYYDGCYWNWEYREEP
jgi:hypothetical protein